MLKWIGGIIAAVAVSVVGWILTTEFLPSLFAKAHPVVMLVNVTPEMPTVAHTAHRRASVNVHNDGKALAEACHALWEFGGLSEIFESIQFSIEGDGNQTVTVDANLPSAKVWQSTMLVRCANAVSQTYPGAPLPVADGEIAPTDTATINKAIKLVPAVKFPLLKLQ